MPNNIHPQANDVRVEEEKLLRTLIRRSSMADAQRTMAEESVQDMEALGAEIEQTAEDAERLAEQAYLENAPGLAKQAREMEKHLIRLEQTIIRHASTILSTHIELHPEHEAEWVQVLYQRLANVQAVLEALYTAIVDNADATDDLRAAVDRDYKDLSQRLQRAEDNPRVAVSTFGTLLHFVELALEAAIKFGGTIEQVWRAQARPVLLPLLR